MHKSTSLLIISLLLVVNLFSQVGIGTSTPNSSAILDLTSSNKGFLPSRIALSGRNDLTTIPSPATGLLIYNTATAGSSPHNVSPGYYYYNGVSWISLATGIPDATIDFSVNADPNIAGTTFSPNTPQSKDYVYVSTIDGSQWTWNGTAYIIYLAARSPFYINNTLNDAGNSKTSAVYRNAAIGVNQSNPRYGLDVSNSQIRSLNTTTTNQVLIDPMDTVGPKIKLGTSTDSIRFMELGAYSSVNNIDNKTRDLKIFSTSANDALVIKSNGNVGVGTNSPYTNLDVVGNIYTSKHANAGLHALSEQTSTFIGHKAGSGVDGFSGMENEIGNYGSVGQSSGSKIHFWTWGNNIATNRRVVTINQIGYLGVGTTSPAAQISNTSSNIAGSDGSGVYGISSVISNAGFVGAFYNSGNLATYNGLAVKVANNSSNTYALDISRGTSQTVAGVSLLSVLGNGNVGIATNTPTSTLQSNGSRAGGITTISTSATLSNAEFVRCTGNTNYTLTLPNASSCSGRVYNIRNHNTQILTISSYINASNNSSSSINSNALLRIVSDGTNWIEF